MWATALFVFLKELKAFWVSVAMSGGPMDTSGLCLLQAQSCPHLTVLVDDGAYSGSLGWRFCVSTLFLRDLHHGILIPFICVMACQGTFKKGT